MPAGAKGGFFLKGDRRILRCCAMTVKRQYVRYIEALLDVTDNLVDEGETVAPAGVRVRDERGLYLVVAADKGTATFSDTANAIAVQLAASGSATRSPPAARRAMTTRPWASPPRARGSRSNATSASWASTPRRDIVHRGRHRRHVAATSSATGCCCRGRIRLIAAYDHRHIFLDPDPDRGDGSFAERERLFEAGRGSSWDDYDREAISAGGGVFSRERQVDRATPQVRRALDITDEALAPTDLIRAILRAPRRPAVERRDRDGRQGIDRERR